MTDEIETIKAKRFNITLIFAFAMTFILASYYLADSLMNRFESSLVDIQPLAQNFNAALGESGEGVKQLSQTGTAVLTQLPEQLKAEYKSAGQQLNSEYQNTKELILVDYLEFKSELSQFKNKINTDISWLKLEIEKWRSLILIISTIFGLIMTLMSIQDILSNIRWLLTFLGFFKDKLEKKPVTENQ